MTNKTHYPLIRTLYLYFFALVGLILATIGGVRFVDMALKAFIFTKAEERERLISTAPPMVPVKIKELNKEKKFCLKTGWQDIKK